MKHLLQHAHFIGIGGSGMSGIAEILHNLGVNVSGSDTAQNATIKHLLQLGIEVFAEQKETNLEKLIHLQNTKQQNVAVVVSSAIHRNNPELIAANLARIPIVHRAEMLAELMRTKIGIGVAGTHGKTTTSSILSTVLTEAGLAPTCIIGGKLNQLGSSAKLGKSDYFVAELDESDGSFLRFSPAVAVITNIDKDHLDFYSSLDEISRAFEKFTNQIPFYGTLCACFDDPFTQPIILKYKRKLITYGLRPDADITAKNIQLSENVSRFTPVAFGKELKPVELQMPGKYNIVNSLASLAVSSALNVDIEKSSQGISKFQGVLHRFTIVGKHKDITVVDDYAHNPQKINTLLQGTKDSFPNHNILCVFQPHRYSRVKKMFREFSESFTHSDGLFIVPIYSANEPAAPEVSLSELSRAIAVNSFKQDSRIVHFTEAKMDICSQFLKTFENSLKKPTIIVVAGAGDSSQIAHDLFCLLQKQI
jgi:UDP-N-acetylmuramate--alanine ligase